MKLLPTLFLGTFLLTACGPSGRPVGRPDVDAPDLVVPHEEGDESETPETLSLQVGLIALEDNGENGPLVGCGDSLIFVTQETEGPLAAEEKIQKALEALFAIHESSYGESGLYTALDEASVTVDSVELDGSQLTVELSGTLSSGGTCDDPRIVEQIKETAKNNAGVDGSLTVVIRINGISLEKQLDAKGD